jgi:hypothetical protein
MEMLVLVAQRLGTLRERVVFLGGATVSLFLTDASAPPVRSTRDVDVIVEIATRAAYYRFAGELRERGFGEDTEANVLCRWKVDKIIVDVMPTDPAILGFSNRWYSQAIATSVWREIEPGLSIRLVTPPLFLATKIEAFLGRGRGDFLGSRDMEDIVTLLDGRAELSREIEESEDTVPGLRHYLAAQLRQWLLDDGFQDALAGHLPPDAASQARVPILIERVHRICDIA